MVETELNRPPLDFMNRTGPTPEGWELDTRERDPCLTYWWIGQDFTHCDNCSRPCWEHPYTSGFGEHAGLRRLQTDEEAEGMWERWGKPKGIPFVPPSRIRAWLRVGP